MARKNPSFEDTSEFNELIARYEEHLKNDTIIYLDADQLADIADKYAEDERFEDAQQAIDYGLKLHPCSTDLLIEQSLLYLDTDRLDQAKKIADSISENSEEVILLKSELLLNEEKPEEAEVLLQQLKEDLDLELSIDIANLYMNTTYYDYALRWIDEAISDYPKNEELWQLKAECHIFLQDQEAVVEAYNSLIDLNPFNADHWINLGSFYYNIMEYAQALNAIDFSLAIDDTNGEIYLIRGQLLQHLDRIDEAIDAYQRALQRNLIMPYFAYGSLGLAYNAMKNWTDAILSFNKAIESTPDIFPMILADFYTNLAHSLSQAGEYDEAHERCNTALEMESVDISEVNLIKGYAYWMQNDSYNAWLAWQRAVTADPSSEAETWIRVSEYVLDNPQIYTPENVKKLLVCLEHAALQGSKNPKLFVKLATLSLILGDKESFNRYKQFAPSSIDFDKLTKFIETIDSGNGYANFAEDIERWKNDYPL